MLVVVLSLVLKIAFLLHGDIINRDGALYIAAAQCHFKGDFSAGLAYYQMPLYPLVLAAVYSVVGNWIIAGKLLSIVPLVGCLLPLYIITRRLFDDDAARWTVLLFAVLPVFNFAATSIMRDPLALLFVLTAIATLLVFYQEGRYRYLALVAVCSVVALLTRVEGVLLFGVIVLAIAMYIVAHAESYWSFGGIAIALVVIMATVFMAIYGKGNYARLDEIAQWWHQLKNGHMFSGYQRLMELLSQMQHQSPAANYHCNLLEVTRHYAPVIYAIGMAELLGKIIFPTSVLAFASKKIVTGDTVKVELKRGRWIVKLVWLLFFVLNIVFAMKMNFTTKRYLWIPAVLLLPWVGNGMAHWWNNRARRPLVCYLLLAVVVCTPLVKTVTALAKTEDLTIIAASQWLHDYDKQHKLNIVYNDRRFYAYLQRDSGGLRSYEDMGALRQVVDDDPEIDAVAVYFSNKHPVDIHFVDFRVIKIFTGSIKTVVLLQRNNVMP